MAQRLSREERMAMRTAQIKPTAGDNIIKHVIKTDDKQSAEAERKAAEEKAAQEKLALEKLQQEKAAQEKETLQNQEKIEPEKIITPAIENPTTTMENISNSQSTSETNNVIQESPAPVTETVVTNHSVNDYDNTPRKGKSLLLKKQKELKSERINFIVTKKAKNNLQKCAKDFGYRSTNDFINELLENLEEYLY